MVLAHLSRRLIHLSRRLICELIVYPCSGVRRRRRSPFSSNIYISKATFMCTICIRMQICTREQIYTRVQICTPLCRVHMPINCVHTHLDLIRNLIQFTHFRRNSLCLNVLNDSNCIISVYVC